MEETRVYLGLGSNIGDKKGYLRKARELIAGLPETEILEVSSLYLTKAWGNTLQDDFINQVIAIKTGLKALELLQKIQEIEINMGRCRVEKWGARIIDIDILLYGSEVIHTGELVVPHPFMKQRLFVLVPLEEINGSGIFPDDGTPIREVLTTVLDREGNNNIQRL